MQFSHARTILGSRGKHTRRLLVVLLVLSSVPWTVDAWAQNLLANNEFDTSLASWSNIGSGNGNQLHDPAEDVAGNAASGAAELSLTAAAPADAQIGIRQCVAVTANQTYNYGTRMKFPTGQASGQVRTFIEVEFFSNAGCGSSQNLGEGEGTLLGTRPVPAQQHGVVRHSGHGTGVGPGDRRGSGGSAECGGTAVGGAGEWESSGAGAV